MWQFGSVKIVDMASQTLSDSGWLAEANSASRPRLADQPAILRELLDASHECWCFMWRPAMQPWTDRTGKGQLPVAEAETFLIDAAMLAHMPLPPQSRFFLIQRSCLPEVAALSTYLYGMPLSRMQPAWGRLTTALMGGLSAEVLSYLNKSVVGRLVTERQLLTLLQMAVSQTVFQQGPDQAKSSTEVKRQGLYQSIRIWLEENFTEHGLSVTQVAEKFGVSTRYVHQLFASFADEESPGKRKTFLATLNALRMERALHLLESDDAVAMTITDIAHHSGYSDPVYFGKAFKQRYGCSPGKMRLQYRINKLERI